MPDPKIITLEFPVVPTLVSLLASLAACATNPKQCRETDYLFLALDGKSDNALGESVPLPKQRLPRIAVSLRDVTLAIGGRCAYALTAAAYADVSCGLRDQPIGRLELTVYADCRGEGMLTVVRP